MTSIRTAITEAEKKQPEGSVKLRLPHWSLPDDHLEVKYDREGPLPWVILHLPTSGPAIGVESKQMMLISQFDSTKKEWVPYEEAHPDCRGGPEGSS